MALDPNIALGVKSLELTNPLAQYGQLTAIQNAQNQNALAQYQLSSAQRSDEQQNKLYAAAQRPDFKLDFPSAIQYGAPGIAALKAQQEATNAQTEGQIKNTTLLANKLALLPEAYKRADTPEAYLALHQSIHADPVLGPWLNSTGATPEKGLASLQNAVQTGKFEDLRLGSMQSVGQLLEQIKPLVVAGGSSVFDPRKGTFNQAPEKPKTTDLMANYEAAKAQGFVGSIFDYEKRIKEAGRTPAQPSAPVSVIVDGKEVYVPREQSFGKTPGNSGNLKQIPSNINLAILKNNQSLKQIDETIALLQKNPDSTGAKGYLPNFLLNRADPEGTEARAGVADIGSIVLHDRSGAAVTAAESPRLMPFIPLATDDNATVIKKLTRMRNIAAGDQSGLTETYSKEQGYIPNPTVGKTDSSAAGVQQVPPIYATNGKERIVSTDGGKTWAPAK